MESRFISIQKLRAMAALAVLGVHLLTQLQRLGYSGSWPRLGGGVDLFFVISGFIMWVTTANKPISPSVFLRKRLIRILPLYWLLTTLLLAVAMLTPSLSRSVKPEWLHVIKSFLFIPAENPALPGDFSPVLVPGWSLQLELPFYGLVALSLPLPTRVRLPFLLVTLCAVAAMHPYVPERTALAFWTTDLVLEFGYGLLVGAFVTSGVRLPGWAGLGFLAAGIASALTFSFLNLPNLPSSVAPGLPMAMIVLGAVICDTSRVALPGAWLSSLGDASYSLYLSHGLLLSALQQVWSRIWPQAEVWNWIAFGAVAVSASAVLALLMFRFVERPLGAWLSVVWKPSVPAIQKR